MTSTEVSLQDRLSFLRLYEDAQQECLSFLGDLDLVPAAACSTAMLRAATLRYANTLRLNSREFSRPHFERWIKAITSTHCNTLQRATIEDLSQPLPLDYFAACSDLRHLVLAEEVPSATICDQAIHLLQSCTKLVTLQIRSYKESTLDKAAVRKVLQCGKCVVVTG